MLCKDFTGQNKNRGQAELTVFIVNSSAMGFGGGFEFIDDMLINIL